MILKSISRIGSIANLSRNSYMYNTQDLAEICFKDAIEY